MKKLLFVVTLSLSALTVAETAPTHTPGSPELSTPVRTQVQSQDKSAKLVQYINACLVQRPSSDNEIRKLLQ